MKPQPGEGNGVAHLHGLVGDEHPVDAYLHDPSPPSTIERMQPRVDGPAAGLKMGPQLGEPQGMLRLPLQLLLVLPQQAQALFEPRTPRVQLVQGQRFGRLRLHQPRNLALSRAPRVLELADPRTRLGRQSLAGTGPPERFCDDGPPGASDLKFAVSSNHLINRGVVINTNSRARPRQSTADLVVSGA
jgi:hypothetical protein